MNKTQNINVGGLPFIIDEDAFTILEEYLNRIDRHFEPSDGYEEIIGDIETRMAELLQEQLKGRKIVSQSDVSHAISVLGSPQDFGAEEVNYDQADTDDLRYTTGKRLFRDPDDKVVAGVCGGLAAYFGIQDPIWVRLIFALAAVGGGAGVLVYIIMWALVPVAETPRDFLAMRGERINVRNIAKIVQDQVGHISDQLSELGNDWKSNRRKKKCRKEEEKSWKDPH